jgi:omega-amidase
LEAWRLQETLKKTAIAMGNAIRIAAIQTSLVWENAQANRQHFETTIASISDRADIILLPEMFVSGFTMNVQLCAEKMDGESVSWMKDICTRHKVILGGSLIVQHHEHYYNRFVWMQPDGHCHTYDKRHLFSYAGEHHHFSPGSAKIIVQVNGVKIALNICYDLRFPMWSRQTKAQPYDVAIFVANWPETREHAWSTLLQARAIENQCWVIGLNRIGEDGNGIKYTGASAIINHAGDTIETASNRDTVLFATIDAAEIESYRQRYNFLADADDFMLLT